MGIRSSLRLVRDWSFVLAAFGMVLFVTFVPHGAPGRDREAAVAAAKPEDGAGSTLIAAVPPGEGRASGH